MNVSVRIGGADGDEALEKKFLTEAALEGMIHLNGHRYQHPHTLLGFILLYGNNTKQDTVDQKINGVE